MRKYVCVQVNVSSYFNYSRCLLDARESGFSPRHPWLFLQGGQSCSPSRWPMFFQAGSVLRIPAGLYRRASSHWLLAWWPRRRQSKILGEILHLPSVKGLALALNTRESHSGWPSELKVLWGFSSSENIGPDASSHVLDIQAPPFRLWFWCSWIYWRRIQPLKDLNHLRIWTTWRIQPLGEFNHSGLNIIFVCFIAVQDETLGTCCQGSPWLLHLIFKWW